MKLVLLVCALLMLMPARAAELQDPPQYRTRDAMMMLMDKLYNGVQTACACKVDGVSVHRWSSYPDVSNWRIDWRGGTTDAQKQAGTAFLSAFDPAKNIDP